MKKPLRILGWAVLAALLVGIYAGYRIIWGHPFNINQLANRQAFFFLVRNPELFTSIGAVDGTILDRHSGKLAPVGVEKRDADYAFTETSLAEVKEFDPQMYGVLRRVWGLDGDAASRPAGKARP